MAVQVDLLLDPKPFPTFVLEIHDTNVENNIKLQIFVQLII